MPGFTNANDAAQYATAGNATITLSSRKTGARYTYKIQAPKDKKNKNILFVKLLTGQDNENDYEYLGMIRNDEFGLTKASKLTADTAPVKAMRYFVKHVFLNHAIPTDLEIRHEGSCGRCGRTLTVPESLDRGIGPECANKMN